MTLTQLTAGPQRHPNLFHLLTFTLLILTGLASCTPPAGPILDPTSTPPPPTITPTETAGCQLFESFNTEVAEGEGYATPQEALEAFMQDETLPGEPVLETEEETSAAWAFLENGERIGFVRAGRHTDVLWNVTGGEWCVDE